MSTEAQIEPKHPLTILQVLPALNVGGVERGTIEFAIYLKQQGHKPVVVSAGGPLVEELTAHEILHITLEVGRKSLNALFLIKKLKRLMSTHQVDIVHARSRLPAWLCYLAIKCIKQQKKPAFVTTLHGLHSVNRYSSIMARGDAVIAVSKTANSYLLKHFNQHLNSDPELVYRGIDPQFHQSHQVDKIWQKAFKQKLSSNHVVTQGHKLVLLPGRLSQLKGFEHLMYWLKNTQHKSKILLTANKGDSNYSEHVHQLLTQHDLNEFVIWLGVERSMVDLYASVDLVVSVNNKAESFGRTVLEALSMGTPVVAFSHGGVSEIMVELYPEGQVEKGDDVELAERIDTFLNAAPEVKPHLKFSNQEMFEKTIAVYHNLLKNKMHTNANSQP